MMGLEGDKRGVLGADDVLFLEPGVGYMVCSLSEIQRAVHTGLILFHVSIIP